MKIKVRILLGITLMLLLTNISLAGYAEKNEIIKIKEARTLADLLDENEIEINSYQLNELSKIGILINDDMNTISSNIEDSYQIDIRKSVTTPSINCFFPIAIINADFKESDGYYSGLDDTIFGKYIYYKPSDVTDNSSYIEISNIFGEEIRHYPFYSERYINQTFEIGCKIFIGSCQLQNQRIKINGIMILAISYETWHIH